MFHKLIKTAASLSIVELIIKLETPVDNLTHQDLLGQTITKPHLEITEATVEERIIVPTINPNSQLKNKEMQN